MKQNFIKIYALAVFAASVSLVACDEDGDETNTPDADTSVDVETPSDDKADSDSTSYIGTEKGHDYVDLGLRSGTLWGVCNVGALTPEAYGDYFV